MLIGITCLVIGVAVVVIAKSAGSEEYRTIGEGIWAPVVVSRMFELQSLFETFFILLLYELSKVQL